MSAFWIFGIFVNVVLIGAAIYWVFAQMRGKRDCGQDGTGQAPGSFPGGAGEMKARWDVFCAVVDNYGDAAVSWRLARQLAAEHGFPVRLWIDDLATLHHLWPAVDPAPDRQRCCGVEVRRWTSPFPETEPADVVIEAFGCRLPEAYLEAMAARAPQPVWVNLEYLSAEDWIEDCHGRSSPHPRLPLTRHFFFPGFTPGAGGLLRERGLIERRDEFLREGAVGFWRGLGVEPPGAETTVVSLFAYENAAVGELLGAWAERGEALTCLVPQSRITADVCRFFGAPEFAPGDSVRRGSLTVWALPFLRQDDYDRLLWACDFNFVRGEDSWVRAQWAGRPFVWHAYPQDDGVHLGKLDAFLDRYCAGLDAAPASALGAFWRAWNRRQDIGAAWPALWLRRDALAHHARAWAGRLAEQEDLAAMLVKFCADRV